MKRLALVSIMMILVSVAPAKAQADATREFLMSATYGALAGTLIGAATLAFADHPGDNLNKVARGASLGLYGGILLGLYVVYGGPSEDSDAAEQLRRQGLLLPPPAIPSNGPKFTQPALLIAPVIGDHGVEGAQANYTVAHF